VGKTFECGWERVRTATGKLAARALPLARLAGLLLCVGAAGLRVTAAPGGDSVGAAEARKSVSFNAAVGDALSRRGVEAAKLCDERDAVSRRVLREYGAIFLAGPEVLTPPVCVFASAAEVASFQAQAGTLAAVIGGAVVELQPAAMRALLAAREEALALGLDITPRDGREAARRNYADTVRLWNSRLLPALAHWTRQGRLTPQESDRMRTLPAREQVNAVLELERQGIYFSRDLSKSILYSVAAPGASQHLSLLAFDVNEYADEEVRKVLARHGWFRTVRGDAPHFTYLGLPESQLPAHGLIRLATGAGEFWVPNGA
jgi:hypothetical protein